MKKIFLIITLLLLFAIPVKAAPACEKLITTWHCMTHTETEPYQASRSGYTLNQFRNQFSGFATAVARARANARCKRELASLVAAVKPVASDTASMRLKRQAWAQCVASPRVTTPAAFKISKIPICNVTAGVAVCIASSLPVSTARTTVNGLLHYVWQILKTTSGTATIVPGMAQACMNQVMSWVTNVSASRFRQVQGAAILRKCLLREKVLRPPRRTP